nr:MAG TPA: hypothetical protein [Caudoviricetes sp.]
MADLLCANCAVSLSRFRQTAENVNIYSLFATIML